MCAVIGIYSLVTAVLICLGYNVLYFEVKLPNGTVAQLLDIMDYVSNSFLMPFISLLTSILIGWVIGPDWIVGEDSRMLRIIYFRCRISHRKICGIFRIYIGMMKRDLYYFLMVTFFAVLHAVQICLPLESLLKALTLT